MKLSDRLQDAADVLRDPHNGYTRGYMTMPPAVLDAWAEAAQHLERGRDRWHTIAHIFLMMLVGLAFVLLWFSIHWPAVAVPVPSAPSELTGDPEPNVMQLDPDTVVTYPNRTVEI